MYDHSNCYSEVSDVIDVCCDSKPPLTSFHCLTEDEVVQVDVRLLHAGLRTAVDCLRSRVVHKVVLVKMTLACLGAYDRTTQKHSISAVQ